MLRGKKDVPLAHLFLPDTSASGNLLLFSRYPILDTNTRIETQQETPIEGEAAQQLPQKKVDVIVASDKEIPAVKVEDIESNRLSLSELLAYNNGQFASYTPGEHSKVI